MINTEVGSQAKKCGVGTGCPTMAQVRFNLVSNTKGEEEEEEEEEEEAGRLGL